MSTTTVTIVYDRKTKEVISRTPENVKIDINAIPKHEMDAYCRFLLKRATEYFKRPVVQAEYEQWLAERKAKEAAYGKRD